MPRKIFFPHFSCNSVADTEHMALLKHFEIKTAWTSLKSFFWLKTCKMLNMEICEPVHKKPRLIVLKAFL